MAIIKCKMCGGDLNIVEGESVCECEYCGTRQTIPTADNEKKLTLFARANRLRLASEFDKAFGIYESIVADFPEEAEAYWGLVLCKYGIEYVDDPATGKKIPTCHRSSFDSVMDDSDFEQVMENSDPISRKIYREEAKQIEEIRKGILEVSGKEEPYDIFICYKETDVNGDRTLDSVLAQDIYYALTDKGYRVFFARITLEDKLGQEYEPYIFAALNSAKIMLAVGTDYEYYNAVWVKNEWSRYLKLMVKDREKHLIPCYKNLDAYDMPKEFVKLQAQDLGKVGAIQDLLRGIEKLLQDEQTVNRMEGNEENPGMQAGMPGVESLLKRGGMFLEDEDWQSAEEYFDRVLDIDPECSQAYLGKLLGSLHFKHREQLGDIIFSIEENKIFGRMQQFADSELSNSLKEMKTEALRKLEKYQNACKERQEICRSVKQTRKAEIESEYQEECRKKEKEIEEKYQKEIARQEGIIERETISIRRSEQEKKSLMFFQLTRKEELERDISKSQNKIQMCRKIIKGYGMLCQEELPDVRTEYEKNITAPSIRIKNQYPLPPRIRKSPCVEDYYRTELGAEEYREQEICELICDCLDYHDRYSIEDLEAEILKSFSISQQKLLDILHGLEEKNMVNETVIENKSYYSLHEEESGNAL